jgi:hypothetical protein
VDDQKVGAVWEEWKNCEMKKLLNKKGECGNSGSIRREEMGVRKSLP